MPPSSFANFADVGECPPMRARPVRIFICCPVYLFYNHSYFTLIGVTLISVTLFHLKINKEILEKKFTIESLYEEQVKTAQSSIIFLIPKARC